ncbi:MAG: dockerin type I domain-containing protein [Calditrichota bacterium]
MDSGSQELAAYGFTVSYNANVLSVADVEAGADGFLAAANTDNPGEIVASGFDASGTGPGSNLQVLVITFNANAKGTSTLGLYVDQLVDGGPTTIGTACGNEGSVEVTDVMLGDVNGDGAIDIVDALLTAQFYVGLDPANFIPLTAQYYVGLDPANFIPGNADVNCDGSIDIVDALLVAQYYVGLLSQFC